MADWWKVAINEDKTEFVVIGTRQRLHKLDFFCLQVDDHNIDPSSNARHSGAIIDNCD